MLPLIIGKQTYSIPSGWHEVKFHQYRTWIETALEHGTNINYTHVLMCLSGIDKKTADNIDKNKLYKNIVPALEWISEVPTPDKLALPKEVMINNIPVKIYKDMNSQPYGFFNDSTALLYPINADGQMVQDTVNNLHKWGSLLCAINLQMEYSNQYTGNDLYDEKVVNELELLIDELPCTQVIPLANFFFHRFKRLMKQEQEN